MIHRDRRIFIDFVDNGFIVTDGYYGSARDSKHVFATWGEVAVHLKEIPPLIDPLGGFYDEPEKSNLGGVAKSPLQHPAAGSSSGADKET